LIQQYVVIIYCIL